MSIESIITTISLVINGRRIVSRIGIVHESGQYQLWANVLNADGCGQVQTMLAEVAEASTAVAVRRELESLATKYVR